VIDRCLNLFEEAGQQYLFDLLDKEIAEEAIAYIAWARWDQWKEFAQEQRKLQGDNQVYGNWEELYRRLDSNYTSEMTAPKPAAGVAPGGDVLPIATKAGFFEHLNFWDRPTLTRRPPMV
jgi:hypothetical protein